LSNENGESECKGIAIDGYTHSRQQHVP
jgi:hypothetical protein